MELTHLKYFIAVAHELHFRRAAKLLNVSQAPLSQQIRRLEDELDVKLFERTSRVVRLTDAGRLFLPEAEAILSRAEHAAGRLKELSEGRAGSLRIGYNEPAINTFLPAALFSFRKMFPSVELHLMELEPEEQMRELRSGLIDIGFIRRFGHDLSEFETRFVFSEPYVLAMRKDHPLAKERRLSANSLDGRELLLFARGVNPALYDALCECFHRSGSHPVFREYARLKSSILALVNAGFGAALVPESSEASAPEGLVFRKIAGGFPPVEICSLMPGSAACPAAMNFLRFVPAHQ